MESSSTHVPRTHAFLRWAVKLSALVLASILPWSDALAGEEPTYPRLKWKRTSLGSGGDSSVAVDSEGNSHVLLRKRPKGNKESVLKHIWFEGRRRKSEDIDTVVGFDNAIAVDDQGGVHVAYRKNTELWYGHDDGTGWQIELVEPGGSAVSMQVDDQGVVHILHDDEDNPTAKMWYVRSTPTGWESEEVGAGSSSAGSALVLRDGMVYATFSSGGLMLATRDLAGVWTIEELDDSPGQKRDTSLAIDDEGTLHVVHLRISHVVHSWLDETGWQEQVLTTTTEFFGETLPEDIDAHGSSVSLASAPDGRLLLVGVTQLNKGEATGRFLWTALLYEQTWFVDTVGNVGSGGETWLAMGPDGLAHMTASKGPRSVLFRLKPRNLRLAVRPKGAGTISVSTGDECVDKCKLRLFPGLDVTLTANPAEGFAFDEWRRACSGTDPTCDLTLERHSKVRARFEEEPVAP